MEYFESFRRYTPPLTAAPNSSYKSLDNILSWSEPGAIEVILFGYKLVVDERKWGRRRARHDIIYTTTLWEDWEVRKPRHSVMWIPQRNLPFLELLAVAQRGFTTLSAREV